MKGKQIKACLLALVLTITVMLPTMDVSAHGSDVTPCSTPPTYQSQSPIVIEPGFATLPASKEISFHYQDYTPVVHNTGSVIEISQNPTVPSSHPKVTVNNVDYFLEEFHFHSDAEHHLNVSNQSVLEYPVEIHFVHNEAPDPSNPNKVLGTVVVAVFINAGNLSGQLSEIFNNLPTAPNTSYTPNNKINLEHLIPEGKYYHYDGSLTTPDYCEGVKWYVFKNPITLTAAHIQNLKAIYPNNDREIQNRNNRVIYKGTY